MSAPLFPALVKGVAVDCIGRGAAVTARDVALEVRERHPERFAAEAERLAMESLTRAAVKALKEWDDVGQDEDEEWEQGRFAEFDGETPRAVSFFAKGEGYHYVSIETASLPQLESHERILGNNIKRARVRHDKFQAFLDFVRPKMTDDAMVGDVLTFRKGD